MKHPEQALQQQVAQYLDLVLLPPTFWTAIAHGGGGKMRGAILKGMGLKPGIPDILIIHDGRAYFIELKSKRGTVSPDQKAAHRSLVAAGCFVCVCRSLDELRATLRELGIRTRETKSATIIQSLMYDCVHPV